MLSLPEKFVQRMRERLPAEEREAFFAVYDRSPYRGLRVNSLKISAAEFMKISPFSLRPVPWEPNGFYTDAEKPGGHPFHFAGLYYSQEPSAMCAAPLLSAQPGNGCSICAPRRAERGRSSPPPWRGGGFWCSTSPSSPARRRSPATSNAWA